MQSYVQTQTAMLTDSFRQEAFRSLKNTPHIVQSFAPNIVQIDTSRPFEFLRSYPIHGEFIAMQHLTDLNYSPLINFNEDDFIVPGQPARKEAESA